MTTWRKWVGLLRSAHPPRLPVVVERRNIRHLGGTNLTKRRGRECFVITISKKLPLFIAWMVLLHEWAHALSWNDDAEVDHDDAWGAAYAMLWREHHEDADYWG